MKVVRFKVDEAKLEDNFTICKFRRIDTLLGNMFFQFYKAKVKQRPKIHFVIIDNNS